MSRFLATADNLFGTVEFEQGDIFQVRSDKQVDLVLFYAEGIDLVLHNGNTLSKHAKQAGRLAVALRVVDFGFAIFARPDIAKSLFDPFGGKVFEETCFVALLIRGRGECFGVMLFDFRDGANADNGDSAHILDDISRNRSAKTAIDQEAISNPNRIENPGEGDRCLDRFQQVALTNDDQFTGLDICRCDGQRLFQFLKRFNR